MNGTTFPSTQARIFAATRLLFDQGGVEAVSTRRIAEKVGITPMAIYKHYPDKDALLNALMLDGFAAWEARVENTIGARYSREAMDLLRMDHTPADRLLDTVLSPTLFSIPTNRRMFRGMVRIADQRSYQATLRLAHEFSGVPLVDEDVGRHLDRSREMILALLAAEDAAVRRTDPMGEVALKLAREVRKEVVEQSGWDLGRLRVEAEKQFGLPLPSHR